MDILDLGNSPQNEVPKGSLNNLDRVLYNQIKRNLPNEDVLENNRLILNGMETIFHEIKHKLAKEKIYLNSISIFGSQLTGLALKSSDIDMTILTEHKNSNMVAERIFSELANMSENKFLRHGFYRKFQMRLCYHPVLKKNLIRLGQIESLKMSTGPQSLDIIMNGLDGIRNSLAIRQVVKESPLFRKLAILIKIWANKYPQKLRLTTFSYYMLVSHYLQHVLSPSLLPPIRMNLREINISEKLRENILTIPDWREGLLLQGENEPLLSELLIDFFKYYGLEYHQEDSKPTIWLEKANEKLWKRATKFRENSTFNILDPFWRLNNQPFFSSINENRIKRVHINDMLKASEALEQGKDIFSEEALRKEKERKKIEKEERMRRRRERRERMEREGSSLLEPFEEFQARKERASKKWEARIERQRQRVYKRIEEEENEVKLREEPEKEFNVNSLNEERIVEHAAPENFNELSDFISKGHMSLFTEQIKKQKEVEILMDKGLKEIDKIRKKEGKVRIGPKKILDNGFRIFSNLGMMKEMQPVPKRKFGSIGKKIVYDLAKLIKYLPK